MIWHIWSFASLTIDGILLSVTTRNAWENPKWFYSAYTLIVLLVFFCELPFIYIVNRIVNQAITSKQREKEL